MIGSGKVAAKPAKNLGPGQRDSDDVTELG